MKQTKTLNWNLYNFEQDRSERLEQIEQQGFANETSVQQMETLNDNMFKN